MRKLQVADKVADKVVGLRRKNGYLFCCIGTGDSVVWTLLATTARTRSHITRIIQTDKGGGRSRNKSIAQFHFKAPFIISHRSHHNHLLLHAMKYQSHSCNPCTRNFLAFVNTTAIAYEQKICRSLNTLLVCKSSWVHKRPDITSTNTVREQLVYYIWEKKISDETLHYTPYKYPDEGKKDNKRPAQEYETLSPKVELKVYFLLECLNLKSILLLLKRMRFPRSKRPVNSFEKISTWSQTFL